MELYFDDEMSLDKWTKDTMHRAAMLCADEEELDQARLTVSVSFVDKEEIHELNKQYRNVDSVTDVLSFPQFDGFEYLEDWGEVDLGDVVICKEKAKEQAEEFGHSYERELIYLFVHSMFHLLGYDHMTDEDKTVMREKEEKIMTKLNILRTENN